jgi:hypothetical protein
VGEVLPGWTEGLQLMQVGGRYRLFVPPDLAFGKKRKGKLIGPYATIIFEIEVLEIAPQSAGDTPTGQPGSPETDDGLGKDCREEKPEGDAEKDRSSSPRS